MLLKAALLALPVVLLLDTLPSISVAAPSGERSSSPAFYYYSYFASSSQQYSSSAPTSSSFLSKLTCGLCKTGISFAQFLVAQKTTHADIVNAAVSACITFRIESKRVCQGIVPAFAVSRNTLSN
ncbi:sphingomyelin phosphodiesterase [Plakobranchus ocellatus]|uniref:Sphingomyelin phosphodiesterase n=1 Tax=Plakobranchus ocellatus TaxID=259542 RepID=A0AAV4A4M3_9GAST|nr:sphingomyelin phosphodiesterase [Plakobranchus ocellatus]